MLVSKELGGAGLIALQLAGAMLERSRESYAWIPGDGPAMAKARELKLKYHHYDATGAFSRSVIHGAVCNWKLSRLLSPYTCGLIHVHSPGFYGAFSYALKMSGLKTLVHVQLEEDRAGLGWAFKRTPDVIITCAQFLIEKVRSALPEGCREKQRIVAIPNAVDIARFHPGDKVAAKLQVGAQPRTCLILMVANLAPHKGQETAIQMVAKLKRKGIEAQLWFAGTEREGARQYTTRLSSLIRDLGLGDRIRLLGQRKDIPELLRAADFFVLPSTSEGLPLSILEAQASKIPVVAAPTAGIPEIVAHGRTGFLAAADSADSYVNYLDELLQNPGLYAKITDAAYAHVVKHHSWKTFLATTDEVYRSVLEENI